MKKTKLSINIQKSIFESIKHRSGYLPPLIYYYINSFGRKKYDLAKYITKNLSREAFKQMSRILTYESIFEYVYPELTEIMVNAIRMIDSESLHRNPTISEFQVGIINTVIVKPYLPRNKVLMRDEAVRKFFEYLVEKTKDVLYNSIEVMICSRYNFIKDKYGNLSDRALIQLFKSIIDLAFLIYQEEDGIKEEMYKVNFPKKKIIQSIKIGGIDYENFDNRGYPLSQLEI